MTSKETTDEKLLDEAEAWIVKLSSDALSIDDKRQFSDWLNTSAEHSKAFDRAYAIWETLGTVAQLPDTLDSQVSNTPAPASGFRQALGNVLNLEWLAGLNPRRSSAAFACLLALLAVVWATTGDNVEKTTPTRYETAAGEILTIELEDGSRVELNTRSVLDVTYTDGHRALELVAGEAYFSVAPDKQRPFIVEFGGGSATALGTAFNIYHLSNATSITVTEGTVQVQESADLAVPRPDTTKVTENQQVKIGRRGMSPVKNIDPRSTLAWREKSIIFNNTPLEAALSELNRYLPSPIDTDASDLKDLRVSGVFSLDSPHETLNALATAFNLTKVRSPSDNSLYLRGE